MSQDKLQLDGIFTEGYGIIPKSVMRDKGISLSAKAIYSYFCSHAGQGDTCFPSQNSICYDLDISRGSLAKYLRELTVKGYIVTEQVKENGRFSHNIYRLPHDIPAQPSIKLPSAKICDTENTVYGDLNCKNNNIQKEQILQKDQSQKRVPASEKSRYGRYENVLLSDDDYTKLKEEFPTDYTERIERLSEYIASKGAKYKNHLATIRSWARRDIKEHQPKNESDGWAYIAAVGKGEIL